MKRQLTIAILGTRGIPNAYGGFEQCAEYVSQGLVARGHSVTVYCSDLHPYRQSQWKHVQLIHCRDPENRYGTIGQFAYDLNCINHARKCSYDVIIQLGYTSSSVWFWRWPGQSAHIVNMDGLEYRRSKYNRPVRLFLRVAEWMATLNTHSLIADNQGIEHHLLKRYPHRDIRFIPYGAVVPDLPEFVQEARERWSLQPQQYDLLICRMEPENNVEAIISAHLSSSCPRKLVIVGNTTTPFGRYLRKTYQHTSLEFTEGIYDKTVLDSLRSHCFIYFHGHSVGGTNPSLLEAMALAPHIAAHDNTFNRHVLGMNASYFLTAQNIRQLIKNHTVHPKGFPLREANRKVLREHYTWDQINEAYETACLEVVER